MKRLTGRVGKVRAIYERSRTALASNPSACGLGGGKLHAASWAGSRWLELSAGCETKRGSYGRYSDVPIALLQPWLATVALLIEGDGSFLLTLAP
jgi:hypothetical protein